MRKLLYLLPLLLLLCVFAIPASAQNVAVNGFCTNGAQNTLTSGLVSSTQSYSIYPGCTVTVNITGGGAATIYSNATGTPLSNPFTATALTGAWTFFVATPATVDVVMSGFGAGISPATFTIPAISVGGGGGGGGTPCVTIPNALQYNNAGAFGCTVGITTPDAGNSLNIKGQIPWVDATKFGMRALTTFNTITATTGTSSPTVATGGTSDFQINDGIVIPTAGAATTQSTPSAPTVTPINATGLSSVSYECVGVDAHWGLTAASPAGSTSTAPTIFGNPAVAISSISRSSNVVTVNTSAAMPFSSGTLQAVIANVTGGTTQFSGVQTVTVTSGTTLTYSQTGANESGTVSASSYVMFENSFQVTSVQATAGSNQLVLTTSVNHSIQFVSSGTRPTMVFLDGINFSGATPQGYANGVFGVVGVTANTITVATQYVSPVTTTATASSLFATSQVAQMTATVWPAIDVTCPAIAAPTKYYAIYANYGSGYSPIGFTPWLINTFEDYGPAESQAGFIAPAAMNLPSTPPASAQNQAYTGQITNIVGTTLTVSPNVPTMVTSLTARHDNGVALQSALAYSCTNGTGGGSNSQGFAPVYIPLQKPGGTSTDYYLFSAPVDISTTCNHVNVIDGGPIFADGTIYADSAGEFDWAKPTDLNGWSVSDNAVGGNNYFLGHASPLLVPGVLNARVSGQQFGTLSNGQIGLMFIGSQSIFENNEYTTLGRPNTTSIPFVSFTTNGFEDLFDNTNFNADIGFQYPVTASPYNGRNVDTGQPHWWPIPSMDFIGSVYPNIKFFGLNYGSYRGIRINNINGDSVTPPAFTLEDMQTFQAPAQPMIYIYGMNGSGVSQVNITRAQMDSIQMPVAACVRSDGGACIKLYYANSALTQSDGFDPSYTGPPSVFAYEQIVHGAAPAQNTNELAYGSNGYQLFGPNTGSGTTQNIYCQGSTGNALSVWDVTGTSRAGLGCQSGYYTMAETTCSSVTGISAFDILCADSVAHQWKMINNAGTASALAGYTITPTNGDCANWSVSAGVILLGDAGSVCGAGGGGMNTNMSNMANPTSMNQTLTPAAANTIAVGTPALPFTNIFIGTIANQAVSLNTASLTGNVVVNIPNATSTPVRACPVVANEFITALTVATGVCSQALVNASAASVPSYVADSGAVNAYVATLNPALVAYAAGLTVRFLPANANTITAPTLNVNGLGAVTITKFGAAALQANDLITTAVAEVIYDGTDFELQNPATLSSTVTTSSVGTFTNKTLNAESTGNSLSEPARAFFPAAGCNQTTAGNGWDIGITQAPTPACAGSTVRKGVLPFAKGNVAYINFHLPNDWNSGASTDINICFTTQDTTNGHVTSFNVQTGFNIVNGTATDDPTLNAFQALSVTIGASQIAGGELCGSLTGMTMTGATANSNFEIAITRNNSGTDTNSDTTVNVKSAELIYGVTKNAANR